MDIAKLLNQLPPDLAKQAKKIIETVQRVAAEVADDTPAERALYAKIAYKLAVEILILAKIKNRTAIKVQLRTVLCMVFNVEDF